MAIPPDDFFGELRARSSEIIAAQHTPETLPLQPTPADATPEMSDEQRAALEAKWLLESQETCATIRALGEQAARFFVEELHMPPDLQVPLAGAKRKRVSVWVVTLDEVFEKMGGTDDGQVSIRNSDSYIPPYYEMKVKPASRGLASDGTPYELFGTYTVGADPDGTAPAEHVRAEARHIEARPLDLSSNRPRRQPKEADLWREQLGKLADNLTRQSLEKS